MRKIKESNPDTDEVMPEWDGSVYRFLICFTLTIAVILGGVVYLTAENADPYPDEINLTNLSPDEFIVINQLEENYITELKVRHASTAPAPQTGVFGSHAIAGFSAKSAGKSQGQFFNYGVTHLGLPEIRAFLAYLKNQNKLPTKTVFIGLHHPHTANFLHITQFIRELPTKIYLLHGGERLTKNVRRALRQFGLQIRERLDWRKLLYVLIDTCPPVYGVTDPTNVTQPRPSHPATQGTLTWLMETLGGVTPAAACPEASGLAGDGRDLRWIKKPEKPLELNASTVSPVSVAGGHKKILSLMREINDYASEDRRIVFFIPPVYEANRNSPQYSLMDTVVLTAKNQGMTVIDDRRKYTDSSFYYDYMHPNERYFMALANRVANLP